MADDNLRQSESRNRTVYSLVYRYLDAFHKRLLVQIHMNLYYIILLSSLHIEQEYIIRINTCIFSDFDSLFPSIAGFVLTDELEITDYI